MKIVNIRGTGGSGKSTVVRRIMDLYPHKLAQFEPNRRQPIWYLLQHAYTKPLMVLGHYETPCGGCDTIEKPDHVFDLIRFGVERDYDVLFEGIIVQDDTRRTLELNFEFAVSVMELDTPLEECLAGVQARRDARGDTRPLDPKNTTSRHRTVSRTCQKLREAGMVVPFLGREEAFKYCKLLLGISE